jgi:hypothetical protein
VALVEINNENALLFEWANGALDKIAPPYRKELGELWTAWLREKHGSDEKVRSAFAAGARPSGPELLVNGDFARGADAWRLETHQGAQATLTALPATAADVRASCIVKVTKPGAERWHVQLGQAG